MLDDNISNIGAKLFFKDPTFVWGRDNYSGSREWISTAIRGTNFMNYIYRDDPQIITIYSFDNTSVSIFKNEELIKKDNLTSNSIKNYDFSDFSLVNNVVKVFSDSDILVTIEAKDGKDYRPLIPQNNEIYSAGNSNYSYITINSNELGIIVNEKCTDGHTDNLSSSTSGFIEITYGDQIIMMEFHVSTQCREITNYLEAHLLIAMGMHQHLFCRVLYFRW